MRGGFNPDPALLPDNLGSACRRGASRPVSGLPCCFLRIEVFPLANGGDGGLRCFLRNNEPIFFRRHFIKLVNAYRLKTLGFILLLSVVLALRRNFANAEKSGKINPGEEKPVPGLQLEVK